MSDVSKGVLDRSDVAIDEKPNDLVAPQNPQLPFEKNYDIAQADEHWFEKLRLEFWEQHQLSIAIGLLICLVGMSSFFAIAAWRNQGLIDIDEAANVQAGFKVDINSAELGEIITLPGVGKKLAQAIIERRELCGGFDSLNELCDVHGIGEKRLESLTPFLLPIKKVDPQTPR